VAAILSAASFGVYLLHPMVIDVLDMLGLPLDPLPWHAAWYVPALSMLVFGLSVLISVALRTTKALGWLLP